MGGGENEGLVLFEGGVDFLEDWDREGGSFVSIGLSLGDNIMVWYFVRICCVYVMGVRVVLFLMMGMIVCCWIVEGCLKL